MSDLAEEAVYAALLYINQRTPRPRAARALMDALRQDGYEVRPIAPTPPDALRDRLAARKLPMVEPVGNKKTDAINGQRASWNAALDAVIDMLPPTPYAPHPGQNHDYRMTCLRCGEPGYLFVGFHSPGETYRWSEAMPKEAE